ncbi:MAG: 50S ribosomal protein L18 [Chloroflexi bacterium]|nr:50S ribosomal protein L18 [Chloroflexota bacterium]
MLKRFDTRAARQRRHRRVRERLSGTGERPRLSVFRSLNHLYGQVIDDRAGKTLVAASTLEPELRSRVQEGNKTTAARLVGEELARRAKQAGVSRVVFDRGGYLYHGRVRALAEGARAGGLEF